MKTRTIVLCQCSICGSEYGKASEAEACEHRSKEKPLFKVGAQVTSLEPRTCSLSDRHYRFKGKIIKKWLEAADEDYENRWLRGNRQRKNSHVWIYKVKYICPHCKEVNTSIYYSPELKLC